MWAPGLPTPLAEGLPQRPANDDKKQIAIDGGLNTAFWNGSYTSRIARQALGFFSFC